LITWLFPSWYTQIQPAQVSPSCWDDIPSSARPTSARFCSLQISASYKYFPLPFCVKFFNFWLDRCLCFCSHISRRLKQILSLFFLTDRSALLLVVIGHLAAIVIQLVLCIVFSVEVKFFNFWLPKVFVFLLPHLSSVKTQILSLFRTDQSALLLVVFGHLASLVI
jgi:hypothetical protein